jgi:hypothetical protein
MPVPSYNTTSFASLQQSLALKLNDPTNVFYLASELQWAIQDSLRMWNTLTGDNKVTYALSLTSGTVWYDLQTISGSPRQCTLTDYDLYTRIQNLLMEGSTPLTLLTSQFTAADISTAVQLKRDEFLLRTNCTRTAFQLPVTPNVATLSMPQNNIAAPRAYWLPTNGNPFPLPKSDSFTTIAYLNPGTTPTDPQTFSSGMESVLTVTLTPPPNAPGDVEFISTLSQPTLPAAGPMPTLLEVPDDFVPAIMWGALGYLLSFSLEAQDKLRADYANSRFEQFIDIITKYPFVMTSKIQDIPTYVDAIEVLDYYSPAWRVTSATPSVIGTAGQNLIGCPTAIDQSITLFLVANADVPVDPDDEINLGQEVLGAIVDYAAHTLTFKDAGAEFKESEALIQSMLTVAARRNMLVKEMSIYSSNMQKVGGREQAAEVES